MQLAPSVAPIPGPSPHPGIPWAPFDGVALARFEYVMRPESPLPFPREVVTDAVATGPSSESRFEWSPGGLEQAITSAHVRSKRFLGQAQAVVEARDGSYWITSLGKPISSSKWYVQRIDGPAVDRWYERIAVTRMSDALRAVVGLHRSIRYDGTGPERVEIVIAPPVVTARSAA